MVISTCPPGWLWRTALSTRLATRLSIETRIPGRHRRRQASSRGRCRAARPGRGGRRALPPATWARSTGSRRVTPRSLVARASSAWTSRSWCPPRASASWQAERRVSASASGSARVTSSSVRRPASGVRSSWEALATKCRWASKEAWSRANRSSRMAPSSVSSSAGAPRSRRRCRLPAEMAVAVAVMARSGPQEPAGDEPAEPPGRPGPARRARRRTRRAAGAGRARSRPRCR